MYSQVITILYIIYEGDAVPCFFNRQMLLSEISRARYESCTPSSSSTRPKCRPQPHLAKVTPSSRDTPVFYVPNQPAIKKIISVHFLYVIFFNNKCAFVVKDFRGYILRNQCCCAKLYNTRTCIFHVVWILRNNQSVCYPVVSTVSSPTTPDLCMYGCLAGQSHRRWKV